MKKKLSKKTKERFDNFMIGVKKDVKEDPDRSFLAIFFGRGITFGDDIDALYEYAKTANPKFAKKMKNEFAGLK